MDTCFRAREKHKICKPPRGVNEIAPREGACTRGLFSHREVVRFQKCLFRVRSPEILNAKTGFGGPETRWNLKIFCTLDLQASSSDTTKVVYVLRFRALRIDSRRQ